MRISSLIFEPFYVHSNSPIAADLKLFAHNHLPLSSAFYKVEKSIHLCLRKSMMMHALIKSCYRLLHPFPGFVACPFISIILASSNTPRTHQLLAIIQLVLVRTSHFLFRLTIKVLRVHSMPSSHYILVLVLLCSFTRWKHHTTMIH